MANLLKVTSFVHFPYEEIKYGKGQRSQGRINYSRK